MATRSRTSFQKRQKEIARMEKQRDKAAKRAQRKLNPTESEESEYLLGEDGLPVLGEDGQPILIRSEEHTPELQSPCTLVCRLLLEKNKTRLYSTVARYRSGPSPRTLLPHLLR